MEIAGLAIGFAGLATLFGSCKDFFDLIEVSQTYSKGFEILDTKFEAQKLRFQIWGQAVGLVGNLPYDRNLDHEAVRPTVERILNNIQLLFLDTDQLKRKYGLRQIEDQVVGSQAAHFWRENFIRFQQRLSRTQDASRVLTKAKWAVSKRDRFEILLRDLKDFIDALENIASSLEQLSRRRKILENDIQTAPSERSLRILQEVAMESGTTISDSASSRFLLLENSAVSHDDDSVSQPGKTTSTHDTFVTSRTRIEDDLVLDRDLGEPGRMMVSNTPQNQRILSSSNILGTVSPSIGENSSGDGFSQEEKATQTRKFFDIKTGDNDVGITGMKDHSYVSEISGQATKRILRDLNNVFNDSITQVSFKVINGKLSDLLGVFLGPRNSQYQGGIFYTRWAISNDYPFRPPTVRFLTKVYHPNIDARGRICVSFLAQDFNPVYSLSSLQLSLVSLLDSPGVEDPLVPEIAEQYIVDRKEYNSIACRYTKKYASGEMPEIAPIDPKSPWWKELQEWTQALSPSRSSVTRNTSVVFSP